MSISMHSAGIDMFVGTWALITIPLFLGHLAGMVKPRWWPAVADLAAAPRLALVHALTFAIPVAAVGMLAGAINLLIEGQGRTILTLLLLLPAGGLNALATLPGLGMLTVPLHVNIRGDVSDLGLERTNEFLWFFDLPWYVWIAMLLFGLLALLVVPLLWNHDRHIEKGNLLAQVVSWLALPSAYFVCSLVLLALVWTDVSVDMGMLGDFAVSYGLAAWMPLVAFFLGAMVELLARFAAPFVDRFLPGVLVNWFRRTDRARRSAAAAAPAPGTPSAP